MEVRGLDSAILACCFVIAFPSVAKEIVTPFSSCLMAFPSHVEIDEIKVEPKTELATFDQFTSTLKHVSHRNPLDFVRFARAENLNLKDISNWR